MFKHLGRRPSKHIHGGSAAGARVHLRSGQRYSKKKSIRPARPPPQHTKGVTSAVSGYAGGDKSTAHYEVVGTGRTGHAESVAVTFDPRQVSLGKILQVYFSVAHNPTELNRQGPDRGTQYRSAIFYADDEQKKVAAAYVAQLDKAKVFPGPILRCPK
jgi:methionine-S-sulfoxide reductase